MGPSLKPFAWCLLLLLLVGAGAADAKTSFDGTKAKDDGPGRDEDERKGGRPDDKPPRGTLPEPDPVPTPPPTSSPPLVESPPVRSPPPVPVERPPLATDATPAPAHTAPSPVLGPVAGPAEAARAAGPDADPDLERADEALLALLHVPAPEATTLPPLVTPTKQPPISGIQAAALPSAERLSLAWALPLAGLVALGVVLSSGRLLQPRPVHPPAPVAAPPSPKASVAVVTASDPLDVPAMLQAAKAAVEAFRYTEAIEWFDRVLLVEPKLAVAHYCRGVCLVGLGRDEEAYEAYRNAYELVPSEGAYRLELARVCGRTGRAGEAMDVLAALLRAMPELAKDVMEDPSFASLRDHPRFLMLTGML